MTPAEVIALKRAHLARFANQSGAAGEQAALLAMSWMPRPKGPELKTLLAELAAAGVTIKASSFDAIASPNELDFSDPEAVRSALPSLTFIEVKTANQSRVRENFVGFFFALTENEIVAAEALGERHRVALFNNLTGEMVLTSVPEIIGRTKSMTWQLSVQL